MECVAAFAWNHWPDVVEYAGSLDYTYSLDQAGQVTGITGIPVSATTGGTETAWSINRAIAARSGPILPFIAETGGLNACQLFGVVDALQSP